MPEPEIRTASTPTERRNGGASNGRPWPLADSVLRLIWSERQISRADIARRLELSRSTVSQIVAALLPGGLVAEVGVAPSRGGRRPIVLEFQDDACCILGVEMGATHVAVALTNLRGRILEWRQREHLVRDDPEGTRTVILDLCQECLDQRPDLAASLVGIGVAMPSPVDPAHPDRLSRLVLPAWGGQSRLDVVRQRFDVPLLIDNDANLGALAEHWWGAGVGVQDFAYIKLGTGIGSGHVIAGEIYRGASGVAGEIGHVAIDPHAGPQCICGLRGCLATFVGSHALVDRARALLADFPDSVLDDRATISDIEEAALGGDGLALQVAREAAEHIGIAVAGMLNLMNPSRVILGGGLARLGDLLLLPLKETVERRTLVSSVAASDILTSDLGPRTVAVGAATMVLKAALDDPSLFPAATRRPEDGP